MKRPFEDFLVVVGIVAALLAVAASASAGPSSKAQEHFDRGGKLYFDGEYSDALLEFKKAHAISPHPLFLYNMSLCHWRLGDFDEAVARAEDAVETAELDEATDAKARARIVALPMIEPLKSMATSVAKRRELEARATESSGLVASAVDARARQLASVPAGNDDPKTLGWIGGGLTVVGAGLLGVFTYYELSLGDDISAYRQAIDDGDRARAHELRDSIERDTLTGRVLLYTGAAVAAVGLTLWVIEIFDGGGERAVSVRAGPGHLVVSTDF